MRGSVGKRGKSEHRTSPNESQRVPTSPKVAKGPSASAFPSIAQVPSASDTGHSQLVSNYHRAPAPAFGCTVGGIIQVRHVLCFPQGQNQTAAPYAYQIDDRPIPCSNMYISFVPAISLRLTNCVSSSSCDEQQNVAPYTA